MRFFNANKMKDVAFAGYVGVIGYSTYSGFKEDKKTADDFRKKYPNAKVYLESRVIAGMGGASYVVAEDKETGKIIARR